jgi:hypothetical protein
MSTDHEPSPHGDEPGAPGKSTLAIGPRPVDEGIEEVARKLFLYQQQAGPRPLLFIGSDLWPVRPLDMVELFLRRMGTRVEGLTDQQASLVIESRAGKLSEHWERLQRSRHLDKWLEAFDKSWSESSEEERFVFLDGQFSLAPPPALLHIVGEWISRRNFNMVLTTDVSVALEDFLAGEKGLYGRDVISLVPDIHRPEYIRKTLKSLVPRVKILKLNGDLYARGFWVSPSEVQSRSEATVAQVVDWLGKGWKTVAAFGYNKLLDIDLKAIVEGLDAELIEVPADDVRIVDDWLRL